MLPARGAFVAADLERNAELMNVPLLPPPENFFTEVARQVLTCQRFITASIARKDSNTEALVDAFISGIHLEPSYRTPENTMHIDEAFLTSCLKSAGCSPESAGDLAAEIQTPAVKQQLAENTEEAVGAGVYGSPTMVVSNIPNGRDPMLIFGSDRFEQVAFLCGKPYYGPDPARPSVSSSRL